MCNTESTRVESPSECLRGLQFPHPEDDGFGLRVEGNVSLPVLEIPHVSQECGVVALRRVGSSLLERGTLS